MTTSKVSEAGVAWGLPAGLSRLRPEACGLLTALNERVWQAGDPVLLELVRVRVAQLIGNPGAVAWAASSRLPRLPRLPWLQSRTWWTLPSSS